MAKINFKSGTATKIKNGKEVPVNSIHLPDCDCGVDPCDCVLVLADLEEPGNKYVIYFWSGDLSYSTLEDYKTFKETGDSDDLNRQEFQPV